MNILKYVIAVAILSVIVIIHEFGHFIVARLSGVKVIEFSVGIGPRILKFRDKRGTLFSLKPFLFGGSCRMKGYEDEQYVGKEGEEGEEGEGAADANSYDEEVSASNEGSFASAPLAKRIAIVLAGPFANFVLAFVLSVILLGIIGYDPAVIYSVDEGSVAEAAGLESGDKILRINGSNIVFYGDYSIFTMEYGGGEWVVEYERDGEKYETVFTPEYIENVYQIGVMLNAEEPSVNSVSEDSAAEEGGICAGDLILSINGTEVENTSQVISLTRESGGNELTIVVVRDGEEVTCKVTPRSVEANYYETGISMANVRVKLSPLKTVGYAFAQTGYWIKAVFKSFKLLFTGKVSFNALSGPVGIVSVMGEVIDESRSDGALYVFLNILNFTIMLTANLGVMNLLPIPAIDGGRLVFLVLEAIRRKPIPREKEGMVNFVAMILLMILMVVVLFNDIRKLFL